MVLNVFYVYQSLFYLLLSSQDAVCAQKLTSALCFENTIMCNWTCLFLGGDFNYKNHWIHMKVEIKCCNCIKCRMNLSFSGSKPVPYFLQCLLLTRKISSLRTLHPPVFSRQTDLLCSVISNPKIYIDWRTKPSQIRH